MVFWHEMGAEFCNYDADGNKTMRLARRENIFTLQPDSINEQKESLTPAGFDLIETRRNRLVLGVPYLFDAHMHFRDPSGLLPIIGKTSSKLLTGAVAMPNTSHYKLDGENPGGAITTTEVAKRYEEDLVKNTTDGFNPMLTLTFGPGLTSKEVELAKKFGVIGIKWYPAGGTVGADPKSGNIRLDPEDQRFEAMEQNDMPFLIHAQRPLIRDLEGNVLEGGPASAEADMLPDVERLALARPNLRIVIEHISTKEACELVKKYPNIHCTVTPQHLIYDDADIRTGHGGLNMPVIMRPEVNTSENRQAIVDLVLNSPAEIRKKIMFGTDSAPHPISQKFGRYKPDCCANGAYNLPVAFEMLLQFLEEHGKLELFPELTGHNTARFYGYDDEWLRANGRPVNFLNEGYQIPRYMRGEEPIAADPLSVFVKAIREEKIPYADTEFDTKTTKLIAGLENEITAILAGGERARWHGYPRI